MRYRLEIFSICSSHVCANLTKKFWPQLNQSVSHGAFGPKLSLSQATVFVEIFKKEKNWWGSGPIGVTFWKDFFNISEKVTFWNFLNNQGVHLQDVHVLSVCNLRTSHVISVFWLLVVQFFSSMNPNNPDFKNSFLKTRNSYFEGGQS